MQYVIPFFAGNIPWSTPANGNNKFLFDGLTVELTVFVREADYIVAVIPRKQTEHKIARVYGSTLAALGNTFIVFKIQTPVPFGISRIPFNCTGG